MLQVNVHAVFMLCLQACSHGPPEVLLHGPISYLQIPSESHSYSRSLLHSKIQLAELDAASTYSAWKITPVCRAQRHVLYNITVLNCFFLIRPHTHTHTQKVLCTWECKGKYVAQVSFSHVPFSKPWSRFLPAPTPSQALFLGCYTTKELNGFQLSSLNLLVSPTISLTFARMERNDDMNST